MNIIYIYILYVYTHMNCKYIHNHIYNIHMLTVATGFVAPTLKGTGALNLEISDIAPYRPRDVCQ